MARRLSLCCALGALAFTATTSAVARPREARAATVTVCSDYGHGCLTAPVRRGRVETEVRMPGGTWIGCKLNCRRTLREEALDFFETLRDRVWDD